MELSREVYVAAVEGYMRCSRGVFVGGAERYI